MMVSSINWDKYKNDQRNKTYFYVKAFPLQPSWGFVDDDKNKIGKKIDEIEVYSYENKLKKIEIYAICGTMDNKIRILHLTLI